MNYYRLNFNEGPIRALHESDRKPEVLESYAVPSGSREDTAHVVRKVQAYTKPWQECDVSSDEDKAIVWLCSCEDFEYNRWPRDGTIPELETLPQCKHIGEIKHEKAQSDDSQAELTFEEV